MLTTQAFLAEIEAFLARSGMAATAFGTQAVNDPNFVHDIRSGRSPSLNLVAKVASFINEKDAAQAEQQERAAS
jgi:hypothetical protein